MRDLGEIDMASAFCCCTVFVSWYNRTMTTTKTETVKRGDEIELTWHHTDCFGRDRTRVMTAMVWEVENEWSIVVQTDSGSGAAYRLDDGTWHHGRMR
jgi:hypothetical protein